MELDGTERAVLIALWEARRRSEALRDRTDVIRIALEAMDGAAASTGFDVRIDEAVERLLDRGLILRNRETREFMLATAALEGAAALHSEDARRGFGDWMVRSERSAAYARYCLRTYGMPLIQFNMIDAAQMDALLSGIGARPGERVVDLGCGVGTITEFIAQRTGAELTGIDFAEAAIERAQARTRGRGGAIRFQIGDLNSLALSPASFHVALALDTLYFAHDLAKTVGDIAELLVPGGRFAAFYSATRRGAEGVEVLKAESTPLARALTAAGFEYASSDFTDRDRAYWQACREAADEMRDEFVAEDNEPLWKSRDDEIRRIQRRHAQDAMRRYLYVATVVSG